MHFLRKYFSIYIIFFLSIITVYALENPVVDDIKIYRIVDWENPPPPVLRYDTEVLAVDDIILLQEEIIVEVWLDPSSDTTVSSIDLQVFNHSNRYHYDFTLNKISSNIDADNNEYLRYRSDRLNLLELGLYDASGFASGGYNSIRFYPLLVLSDNNNILRNKTFDVYASNDTNTVSESFVSTDSLKFTYEKSIDYEQYIISDSIFPVREISVVVDAKKRNPFLTKNFSVYVSNITRGETIVVPMQEFGGDFTNIFFNKFPLKLGTSTSQQDYRIKCRYGDELRVTLKNEHFTQTPIFHNVQMTIPETPTAFLNVTFQEPDFYSVLERRLYFEEKLSIEAVAKDENYLTPDTVVAYLTNYSETVEIILTQTEIIDGYAIFRNDEYSVNTFTDTYDLKTIRVDYDSEVHVSIKNHSSIFNTVQMISKDTRPVPIHEVRFRDVTFSVDYTENFVRPTDNIFIRVAGQDRNPYTRDKITAYVWSEKYNDTIVVECLETENNSGLFRSGAIRLNFQTTSTGDAKLRTDFYDTIFVKVNGVVAKTAKTYTARPQPPTNITSFYFSDNNYNEQISEKFIGKDGQVYITLFAEDLSPLSRDTITVYLKNLQTSDSIYFDLLETGENSGKFVSNTAAPRLSDITVNDENYLKADFGDTIVTFIYDANGDIKESIVGKPLYDTVYVTNNVGVIKPYDIRLYQDPGFSIPYEDEIAPFSTVYVELWGKDENPLLRDILSCSVIVTYADGSGTKSISIDLTETSNTSGRYRGEFLLSLYTDDKHDVIRASKTGDTIYISYTGKNDENVSYTLLVREIARPLDIIAMNLYFDASYDPLSIVDEEYEFNFDEQIYIEVIAYDSNPMTQDIISVIVYSEAPDGSDRIDIQVDLHETEKNSGIYRNVQGIQRARAPKIDKFTNDTLNEIRSDYGYTIKVKYIDHGATGDTIVETKMTVPRPPERLNELYFYTGPDYNTPVPRGYQQIIGELLYMQMAGLDGNPRNADQAYIYLIDSSTPDTDLAYLTSRNDSSLLTLQETGRNTGIYRGTATLARRGLEDRSPTSREIGTTEGRYIIILAYDPFTGEPDTYGYIATAKYSSPHYVHSIRLMERNNYANTNQYPNITMETAELAQYRSKAHLSNLWIQVEADTETASNLLQDTLIVEVISFRGDTYLPPGFDLDNIDWSYLADADFCSKHVRDTILVQLREFGGPNTGRYRNYDDRIREFASIRLTSNREYKEARVNDLISPGRSGFLLVQNREDTPAWSDIIVVRAVVPFKPAPFDPPPDTDIYSPTFNPAVSPQKRLATKVPQDAMTLISLRFFESSSYTQELNINERSFEGNLDKFYVRARIEDPGPHSHILFNEMTIRLRNNTRFYADGSNPNLEIGDGRGADHLEIRLVETDHSSNVFLTDPNQFAEPIVKIVTKQFPQDFATRTNQDNGFLYAERGDTIQIVDLERRFEVVEDFPPPVEVSQHRRPNPYRIVRTNASYNQVVTANYLHEETVYLRALGEYFGGYPSYASNPMLRDKMVLTVENLVSGESFPIELYETAPRSEDYRIDPAMTPYFRITNFTVPAAYDLAGEPGDTIVIWGERRVPININDPEAGWDTVIISDSRIVARATEPQNIRFIDIKNDASYTINLPLDEGVVLGQTIYVQLVADIGDPALIDQTWGHVVRSNDPTDTIAIRLVQASLGSPYYRGTFTISDFTNDQSKEIGVVFGETIYVQHHIQTEYKSPVLTVTPPQTPTNVNSVHFTNSSYTQRLVNFNGGYVMARSPGNVLHIELNGNDPNPRIADEALVLIESITPLGDTQGSIIITLKETGLSTGKYRNTITIADSSDTNRRTIRGFFGDMIKVTSLTHPHRSDTALIPLPFEPEYITDLYIRDSNYQLNLKNTRFSYSDFLYIEAHGHFGNPFFRDTTLVEVYAVDEYKQQIPNSSVYTELIETTAQSGIYRGKVRLADNEYLPNQVQTVFYNPLYNKMLSPSAPEEKISNTNETSIKSEVKSSATRETSIQAEVKSSDIRETALNTKSKNFVNIKKPRVEVPVLGNLKGFHSIKIAWPVELRQIVEEYDIIRAEPGSVYPNPWRIDEHQGIDIRFENIAANSEIMIFDVRGYLIKKDVVTHWEPAQGYERYYYDWDLTNNNNSTVSSGIYIYIVQDRFGSVVKGKLGIIR